MIETVRLSGLACNLSVKLTQFGLELDGGLCRHNLDQILSHADRHHAFVRVDMETAALVDDTLDIVEAMRKNGHTGVGVVLQSALRRTSEDLSRIIETGLSVRLVKGAYKESSDIAFPDKADVDRAFVRLAERLLGADLHAAFATHDPRMIKATCTATRRHGVSADRFEFQMLYGVRRDLQAALEAQGYAVRIYLPFGEDWFKYFMRRLAERPANVPFVAQSLMYEQLGDQRSFG